MEQLDLRECPHLIPTVWIITLLFLFSQYWLFSLEAEKRNGSVLCFVIAHKSSGRWSNKFHFIGRLWSLFLFKVFLYSFMPRCLVHLHDLKEFPDCKVWSGSIDGARGGLTQPRGTEIFSGVFSCKFLVLQNQKISPNSEKGLWVMAFYYP